MKCHKCDNYSTKSRLRRSYVQPNIPNQQTSPSPHSAQFLVCVQAETAAGIFLSPRLSRLQLAEFLLSSGHRYTSPVCCFPVDSNGAPTSNLGSHTDMDTYLRLCRDTNRGLLSSSLWDPERERAVPRIKHTEGSLRNEWSLSVSGQSLCFIFSVLGLIEFYCQMCELFPRGQLLSLQQLLQRSVAVVLNRSAAAAAAAASHSEQVISVNWSKHHHMWSGWWFWEEGWVTFLRRCHSRALTLNLLMHLHSTSNAWRAALTNHIPNGRRSESTSCSRQRHRANRNLPLILWHQPVVLIISWTGAVI